MRDCFGRSSKVQVSIEMATMVTRTAAVFVILIASMQAQASPSGFSERSPRYRLQPTDVIEVQYRYTPEYNQVVTVQPDGFISLQLISDTKVAGLTLDEVRTEIVQKASKVLNDPVASVLLKEYDKPHFVVGGEVKNPGRFDLRGRTGALEAIEMAGGFNALSAKASQVILFRRLNNEMLETKVLNLQHAIKSHTLEEDVTLQPGDLLVVPQNRISKIERYIKYVNLGLYYSPFKPL